MKKPSAGILENLAPDSDLSSKDVVDLLAPRLCNSRTELRARKDKLRKRLRYAAPEFGWPTRASSAGYKLNDVVYWARREWPGQFEDLPMVVGRQDGSGLSSQLSVADSFLKKVFPGSLEDCHQALDRAYDRVDKLQEENRVLGEVIRALRTEIDSARHRSAAAKVGANKPRRRRR